MICFQPRAEANCGAQVPLNLHDALTTRIRVENVRVSGFGCGELYGLARDGSRRIVNVSGPSLIDIKRTLGHTAILPFAYMALLREISRLRGDLRARAQGQKSAGGSLEKKALSSRHDVQDEENAGFEHMTLRDGKRTDRQNASLQ